MTDRELLELAAKAAQRKTRVYEGELQVEMEYPGVYCFWSPLTDDGDALRLAVKLNITIGPDADEKSAIAEPGLGIPMVFEDYLDDPYAATRRAIVRAAAEIGKLK